ncbi:Cys-tRNA(Pro) deacylase [Desertimonas flava]|uniref:Cys-tRNA(Pro) deacylase n=1 Tax=Desertimonas flava TaxID=2064846 RepID=UPI001968FBEA|nr:Cys-tRNA(Pro) deacylase [Desertimonas flava]
MTPAVVALEAAGIAFTLHQFDHDPSVRDYGREAADAIGADHDQVFKTLLVLTYSSDGAGKPAVAIVPVSCQLSLKLAGAAFRTKRVEMCDPSLAERTTGYVVGGISPLGQRKRLPTAIDETAELWDTIYVSGGRRGLDIGVAPADLVQLLDAVVAPLTA